MTTSHTRRCVGIATKVPNPALVAGLTGLQQAHRRRAPVDGTSVQQHGERYRHRLASKDRALSRTEPKRLAPHHTSLERRRTGAAPRQDRQASPKVTWSGGRRARDENPPTHGQSVRKTAVQPVGLFLPHRGQAPRSRTGMVAKATSRRPSGSKCIPSVHPRHSPTGNSPPNPPNPGVFHIGWVSWGP